MIVSAGGTQEFEVEADNLEEARAKFEQGDGKLVEDYCEVMDLDDYDLDSIWEEGE